MKHIFTILALLIFTGCSQAHVIVPVAYYDCDPHTGIYGDVYWFEGELHKGDGGFDGYVSVTKFLEVQARSSSKIRESYNVDVPYGHYAVNFRDGEGLYILLGKGSGKHGITVEPSFLPDVGSIAGQYQERGRDDTFASNDF
jgi:hypothetical protein